VTPAVPASDAATPPPPLVPRKRKRPSRQLAAPLRLKGSPKYVITRAETEYLCDFPDSWHRAYGAFKRNFWGDTFRRASRADLAREARCNLRTLKRITSALEELGILEVQRTVGGSFLNTNAWRIHVPTEHVVIPDHLRRRRKGAAAPPAPARVVVDAAIREAAVMQAFVPVVEAAALPPAAPAPASSPAAAAWAGAIPSLRAQLGEDSFTIWIAPLAARELFGEVLVVEAPDHYCSAYVRDTFGELVEACAGRQVAIVARGEAWPSRAVPEAVRSEETAEDAAKRMLREFHAVVRGVADYDVRIGAELTLARGLLETHRAHAWVLVSAAVRSLLRYQERSGNVAHTFLFLRPHLIAAGARWPGQEGRPPPGRPRRP
jgi:hypothetical protein